MVMASGWQSFDRQFEPFLHAFMAAPLRCGWDAVPEPMVEYIDPDFFFESPYFKMVEPRSNNSCLVICCKRVDTGSVRFISCQN
jgi:hypothetical protein